MIAKIAIGSALDAIQPREVRRGDGAARAHAARHSDLTHDLVHPDRIRIVDGDKASGDHHSDPVGQRHDLFEVGGHDEHGGAAIALAPQDRVDFRLGAHVDADRRFVENEDARGACEPFADQHLLLVAAREQIDRRSLRREVGSKGSK